MDYAKPPEVLWHLRAAWCRTARAVMQTWPCFESRVSRKAIKSNKPVPVTSCWNGICKLVAVSEMRLFFCFHGTPLPSTTSPRRSDFAVYRIALRYITLKYPNAVPIHADNNLTHSRGEWLNSKVRVGYSSQAYNLVNQPSGWLTISDVLHGIWEIYFAGGSPLRG